VPAELENDLDFASIAACRDPQPNATVTDCLTITTKVAGFRLPVTLAVTIQSRYHPCAISLHCFGYGP
jgi:hypothetical protein